VLQVSHEEVRDPKQQGHLAKEYSVQLRLRQGRGELELNAVPQRISISIACTMARACAGGTAAFSKTSSEAGCTATEA